MVIRPLARCLLRRLPTPKSIRSNIKSFSHRSDSSRLSAQARETNEGQSVRLDCALTSSTSMRGKGHFQEDLQRIPIAHILETTYVLVHAKTDPRSRSLSCSYFRLLRRENALFLIRSRPILLLYRSFVPLALIAYDLARSTVFLLFRMELTYSYVVE